MEKGDTDVLSKITIPYNYANLYKSLSTYISLVMYLISLFGLSQFNKETIKQNLHILVPTVSRIPMLPPRFWKQCHGIPPPKWPAITQAWLLNSPNLVSIYCGLVTRYGDNTDSGDGFTWTSVELSLMVFCGIYRTPITTQEVLINVIRNMSSEIALLN